MDLALQMRLLNKQLHTLSSAIDILKDSVKNKTIEFALISDAPFYIRLFSRGEYCAYKNVIYTPELHLSLVCSKHEEDRSLSTAKLLPFIMLINDYKSISFFRFLCFKYSNKYKLHYFLYEFFFLKFISHPLYEPISIGFMTSRRSWIGKKLSYEFVENRLNSILTQQSYKL